MKETTISILLPWSPLVLEMEKVLETQVILESLTLRVIIHKLTFKGGLILCSFILHNQEGRHSGAF